MDIIDKRRKILEILRLLKRRQEIRKPGNLQFKFGNNSNRKYGSLDDRKNKKDKAAAIDLELLFRITKKNRWGVGYFEFKKPEASSGTEQSKNKPEPVSNTVECEVAKSLSNFPIVDLKDFDIAEKTIHIVISTMWLKNWKWRTTKQKKIGENWV